VLLLTEDLKTTDQYKEKLFFYIAELEKEANGYADHRDLLSPVINFKSDLSKIPSFPLDKDAESSKLYNESIIFKVI
jgi:hypothetical protein